MNRRPARVLSAAVLAVYALALLMAVTLPHHSVDDIREFGEHALAKAQGLHHGILQLKRGFIVAGMVSIAVAPLPVAVTSLISTRPWLARALVALGLAAAIVALDVRSRDMSASRLVSLVIACTVGYVLGVLVTEAARALWADRDAPTHVRATGRSRIVAVALSIVYACTIAAIAFHASPVDGGSRPQLDHVLHLLHLLHGIPQWFDYSTVEFTANIALFLPLGLLVVFLFGGRFWWVATCLGILISCAIETAQALFLPQRFASVDDVVANSTGAVVGALAGVVLLWRSSHRSHRRHQRSRGAAEETRREREIDETTAPH